MKHESIKAKVRWAPRETNREADRLANGDHSGFDSALRSHVGVVSITWYVLPEARGKSSGRYTHTRDSGQEKQNDSCRLCALQRN